MDAVKVMKQQLEVHMLILQHNLIPLHIHPEVQLIILQHHHQILVTIMDCHGYAVVVVVIIIVIIMDAVK
jgi:hypothetical protein